jgi:hypothetical protein
MRFFCQYDVLRYLYFHKHLRLLFSHVSFLWHGVIYLQPTQSAAESVQSGISEKTQKSHVPFRTVKLEVMPHQVLPWKYIILYIKGIFFIFIFRFNLELHHSRRYNVVRLYLIRYKNFFFHFSNYEYTFRVIENLNYYTRTVHCRTRSVRKLKKTQKKRKVMWHSASWNWM